MAEAHLLELDNISKYYGNIIALNEHAAVLHYQHQSRHRPTTRRSFLIDAGASVNGYAADITRTHSCKDDAFADLVDRMHELQLAITAEVRVGVNYADLHIRTHERIAELLVDLNLASGSSDALYSNGVTSAFFPHGLGHMMGLDVHDMEDLGEVWVGYDGEPKSTQFGLKSLRLARPLQPGFVLTIEPGIYFIPQLMDLWRSKGRHLEFLDYDRLDQWRDFGGIRNEENYLIQNRNRVMSFMGGIVSLRGGVDGIALGEEWLYFGALSGSSLYRIRLDDIRDSSIPNTQIAARVEHVAKKPLSDGFSIDTDGRVYITDVEHNAVFRLDQNSELRTLIRSNRVRWPDALSFGPGGWLYVADSALSDVVLQSKEHIKSKAPYRIFRVQVDAEGTPGQ